MNNKYTIGVVNETNIGNLAFREAQYGTDVDLVMSAKHEEYQKLINRGIFSNNTVAIIFYFILGVLLLFSCFLIGCFKNKHSLLLLLAFALLIINEIITAFLSIKGQDLVWMLHNNIMRSGTLLIYLFLMIFFSVFVNRKKKINEKLF